MSKPSWLSTVLTVFAVYDAKAIFLVLHNLFCVEDFSDSINT